MGIIDTLTAPFRRGNKPNTARKGYGWGPLTGLTYGNAGFYGQNRDLAHNDFGAATAHTLSIAAYRAVDARMRAVGSMPWRIIDERSDEIIDESDSSRFNHPFAKALKKVYRTQNQSLFAMWELSMCVTGKAFIEPVQNDWQYYTSLEWLNPVAVQIVEQRGRIEYFQYNGGDGNVKYAPDELAYERFPTLLSDHLGLAPLYVAMRRINISLNTDRFLMAFYRNDARFGQIISPPDGNEPLSEVEVQRIKQQALTAKGSDGSWLSWISPYAVKTEYPDTPDLSKQTETNDRIDSSIYTALGVPRPVAGDVDGQRYQASPEALEWFYQNTVNPRCRDIAGIINDDLLPRFDRNRSARFEFDTSEWERLSETKKAQLEFMERGYENGVVTYNELRSFYNNYVTGVELKPIENGNLVKIPGSGILTRLDDLGKITAEETIVETGDGTMQELPDSVDEADAAENSTGVENARATGADTNPAYAYIDLANTPKLIEAQNDLKRQLSSTSGIEWQSPNTYHITLVYAPDTDKTPDISDMQFNALDIRIDGIGTFDNPGERALYLSVDRDDVVAALQRDIYARFGGIETSEYSIPANWTPHITMAYIPDDLDLSTSGVQPFAITAGRVSISRDDYDVVASVEANEKAASQEDALSELRTWRKYAKKHGVQKALEFETFHLEDWQRSRVKHGLVDGEDLSSFTAIEGVLTNEAFGVFAGNIYTTDYLNSISDYVDDDAELVRLGREHIIRIAAQRAIQSTRIEYEDTVEDMLLEAVRGNIDRRRAGNILRGATQVAIGKAYIDGLEDGGITEPELTNDDREWIADWYDQQRKYINALMDAIYKDDRVTEDEVKGKPAMWFVKSVQPAYHEGLASASKNGSFQWALGNTEDHCRSCLALNGQVRRMSFWRDRIMPGDSRLECRGYRCDCKLVPSRKSLSRGRLPAWRAAHNHAH